MSLAANGPLFTFDARVVNDAIKSIYDNKGFDSGLLAKKEGRALITENYRILSNAVDSGMTGAKKDGITHEVPPELTAALKNDAYMFSGFKAYHTMREAGLSLVDDKGGIKGYGQFKSEAGDVFKKQGLNLRAEYQHTVQSSLMATRWAQYEADGDRYDLQYRTVGDDHVREAHRLLDGFTAPPSDRFWDSYYPPNGWGCRCTVSQVRKGKYDSSLTSAEAVRIGDNLTDGDKQKIFRFNPGKQKRVFPAKHPNYPKGCAGCDGKVNLSWGKGKPECDACKIIQSMLYEIIPTKKGIIRCSAAHGRDEKAKNIIIAKYFAETHGHEIELLPRSNSHKCADVYNKTLGIEQEYKTNEKPTKNAIDNEIRDASKQADNIVIYVNSGIDDDLLKRGIKGRVKWAANIQSVTIVKDGQDKTYTRDMIISKGFEL